MMAEVYAWLLRVPLLELGIDNPVGKALPANSDTLQDAIAPQLVNDKVGVDFACT